MKKINLDKRLLKKFGIMMGFTFLVINAIILMRHKNFSQSTVIISVIFFVLAYVAPIILKPIYIFWMKLAFVLSWINTRLILLIIFYLIFTPISLVMRLFGIDLLDRRIEKNKESYWKPKEKREFNSLNYERQF